MSQFKVNNKIIVEGKMTVEQAAVDSVLKVSGVFASETYIDDIKQLECERYIVTGVNVYAEVFGSEEPEIAYHFIASALKLKK